MAPSSRRQSSHGRPAGGSLSSRSEECRAGAQRARVRCQRAARERSRNPDMSSDARVREVSSRHRARRPGTPSEGRRRLRTAADLQDDPAAIATSSRPEFFAAQGLCASLLGFRYNTLSTVLESAVGGAMDERTVSTADVAVPGPRTADDDAQLLTRLRAGDEHAFTDVVDRWSRTMLRVARAYVSTDASAQEVVQDTWLAVIRGLDGFQERSTLKTWVFRILVNTAKTRGVREVRTTPMSSLVIDLDDASPTVDPSRFRGPGDQYPGGWAPDAVPQRWEGDPAREVLRGEIRSLVSSAMGKLPERQRAVVLLRDVQGCDSDEVCQILSLTPENQRVLLHRGRASVRMALEDYYHGGAA